MSLEKVFEVEIDGKEYKLEVDNMAFLKFEKLMGKNPVTWVIEAEAIVGQPLYGNMLMLFTCAIAKHHPGLRLTTLKLTNMIPHADMCINLGRDSIGDKLIEALQAGFPEKEDLGEVDPAGEPDPLDGTPQDGGT